MIHHDEQMKKWREYSANQMSSLTREQILQDVKKYISYLQSKKGLHLTSTAAKNINYKNQKKNLKYSKYIWSADNNYFAARTLMYHSFWDYALFCSYMCIENYLKAILKYNNIEPPDIHHLFVLLKECKKAMPKEKFLKSQELKTIIKKFEPFYESPRYPIYKYGPGKSGGLYPNDMYLLDYFVYEIKKIISPINLIPWTPHIMLCKGGDPEFYEHFKIGNINFK